VIAHRILSIVAAVLLVGAFALASADTFDLALGDMLSTLDPALPTRLRAALPGWMADGLLLPLLLRPAWMLPAALGLVSAGVALTITRPPAGRRGSEHGRR
jgi:hypothetical protein